MEPTTDRQPGHLRLHQQLKGAYLSLSLTLLSIIQAVVLAALAAVVVGSYQQFTAINWLMVLATFAAIAVIYLQIVVDVSALVWIPTLEDAAPPFLIGALELFLSYTVDQPLGIWLFGLAALGALDILAGFYVMQRIQEEPENGELRQHVRRYRLGTLPYSAAGAALFLLAAIGNCVAGFKATGRAQDAWGVAAVAVALLAVGWVAGYAYRVRAYWRGLIRYARTGHLPRA